MSKKFARAKNYTWFQWGLSLVALMLIATAWTNAFKVYRAEIYVKSADRLIETRHFTRAETVAQEAINLNPRNGYAWFHYATAKYLQRQFGPAIKAYKSALPVLPHYYNAIRLMAIAQYKDKQYHDAANSISDYLTMNPWPAVTPEEIYRIAGLSWLRVGNLAASNDYLTWASHYAEQKGEILKVQAMVTILMNQPDSADYYFRSFRHFQPGENFNPYELVTNAMAANKVNGAIKFMESINQRNPEDLSVVKALAIAYSRIGGHAKAELLLGTTAATHPENAELRLIYGDVLFAQRKYKEAFEQYDQHLRLEPDSRFRQDILQKKATSRY